MVYGNFCLCNTLFAIKVKQQAQGLGWVPLQFWTRIDTFERGYSEIAVV